MLKITLCIVLPHHGLSQNLAIGGILSRERAFFVLDAEHHQRLIACIANRTLGGGSNAHYATLGHGDNLAIDLHLALALEEEVELLVSTVGMQESCLTTYGEALERELGTRSAKRCASKYLTRDLYLGAQRENVLRELGHLAYRDARIASTLGHFFNLFHTISFYLVGY